MLSTLCLADEKYCAQLVTGYWEVQEIKDANRNSTFRFNTILTASGHRRIFETTGNTSVSTG